MSDGILEVPAGWRGWSDVSRYHALREGMFGPTVRLSARTEEDLLRQIAEVEADFSKSDPVRIKLAEARAARGNPIETMIGLAEDVKRNAR